MNHIAIFDIGKTNKKLFVFDENYQIVHEIQKNFEEIKDDDEFLSEDIQALSKWVLDSFEEIKNNPKFNIKALNFSCYGASFVHLDKNGKVLGHLENYLKPFPKELHEQFIKQYSENVFVETASPDLENLNSGMQIYRLKYAKPDFYNQIACSLHFPQYLSYLFTNQLFSDITSIGCHTALWNFSHNEYHHWVMLEQLKLAPIIETEHAEIKENLAVGIGLHDSSAALIPYLVSDFKDFVLISTGTWSISLNPYNNNILTKEELEKDCLQFLSYEAKPVKASRLFLGNWHQTQSQRIANHFNIDHNYLNQLSFEKNINLQHIVDFSDADLNLFPDAKTAYFHLVKDLVDKQKKSTDLVILKGKTKKIFVEGGFSKNQIFMHLLAHSYPECEVFASEIGQASALGAAIVLHKYWNKNYLNLLKFIIFKKY